eukprot:11153889-Alexandrium_andersonii.AAC.1
MSASLVGSEMCIRDSSGSAGVPMPRWRRRSASCARPPFLSRLPRLRPVSYTHLTLPTICSV